MSTTSEQNRTILQQLPGMPTSDGAGVKLTRIIGTPQLDMLDPFLMLDCFESDDADDYVAGFPTHPHRGFETVTYLLNGRMRHKDNAGNEGVIEPGGVQWMTAAKGILHSEMPEQEEGLLKGFQLWVNLPAKAKMGEPEYQEFPPESTPLEHRENGTEIRVIAGETNQGTVGPVINQYTYPTYMDVSLPANTGFEQSLAIDHNAFIYVIEGEVAVQNVEKVSAKNLAILSKGDTVSVTSGDKGARFLLIAGKPLNESVARMGPFVMNTQAEIRQAVEDFHSGKFAPVACQH
ncbi:pirin family protein [Psychrobacter sp. APC 3426]|uniref:pirin family protein n=1 Tax=Psychrobacter sp. APC 3426 TaxID=3035177 RepID=UPI0025B4BC0C|nr:pirin family protein [Psychrobacter sp. APC 3426]MDN3398900.1 pirin family protein [Psychrobacter sp. APC 3426]